MDEYSKISGVKRYLRRTKTSEELASLADLAFASASEEVTITSINADGASTSGTITLPKWLLLAAIEEVLAEGSAPRQLATSINRSHYVSPI